MLPASVSLVLAEQAPRQTSLTSGGAGIAQQMSGMMGGGMGRHEMLQDMSQMMAHLTQKQKQMSDRMKLEPKK